MDEAYVISQSMLCGHFAMWAVRQSPYGYPAHLPEALAFLRQQSMLWCMADPHSTVACPMRRCTEQELLDWLTRFCEETTVVQGWNTPASGHHAPYILSSRFGQPAPDDDIIDLEALVRNVARSVFAEVEAER